MTKPRLMCRKHLMGEHVEMHMFIGGMRKGISMEGYAENELFEPASLLERHDDLALEMAARGYRHSSPMPEDTALLCALLPSHIGQARVPRDSAREELIRRCPECRQLHEGVEL